MLDTDGTTLWQNGTYDPSNGTMGCSAFDFEGDGYSEVVYPIVPPMDFCRLTGNTISETPSPHRHFRYSL